MGFIDNLRKKMAIDKMASSVIASLRPPGSERHLERDSMVTLLEMAGFRHLRRRELDFYLPGGDAAKNDVVVLDNDLPRYRSSVEDVEMRKNPVVKEMVSIRNIRKILVDSDVVVSKQADTVRHIQQICLAGLNLDWMPADIRDIAAMGARSLENNYTEGVADALALFSELLGFTPPPKTLQVAHHDITGLTVRPGGGGPAAFGPLVAFSRIDNSLRVLDATVRLDDAAAREHAVAAISGKCDPSAQGRAVFDWLEKRVLSTPPPVS